MRGVPDIVGESNGRFFGIECKLDEKKYSQTPLQKVHEKMINEDGGIYIVALPHNWLELVEQLLPKDRITGVQKYGKKKREKFSK